MAKTTRKDGSALEPTMISNADALAEARRWYDAQVDAITRAWEPRFRHRQYRPDEDGDWEGGREAPRREFEGALSALPFMEDHIGACLVFAVSPRADDQYDDGATVFGNAITAMVLDVLAGAQQLGYFAEPCPEALRFPDLPELEDCIDDFWQAEEAVKSAQMLLNFAVNTRETEEEQAEARRRLDKAQKHLAAIRSGEVAAFTAQQKKARHVARRREIVAAYRARLEAAHVDAGWVDVDGTAAAGYTTEEAELAAEVRS